MGVATRGAGGKLDGDGIALHLAVVVHRFTYVIETTELYTYVEPMLRSWF